jgi:hypothetical protein
VFDPFNYPLLILVLCFLAFWISARIGASFRKRRQISKDDDERDFTLLLGATLTLLGLIIGFTFSMAVSRYDQRKNLEEEEANAIGTEYLRANLLPAADASKVHELLKRYLDARILSYKTPGGPQDKEINSQTAELQAEMWSAVATPAAAQPTPVTALIISGMNDVLNSQGYTQAAWWNRIPLEAWALLIAISIFCNLLIGYGTRGSPLLFLILPTALSISLFLIADIDTPRHGVIRVHPQNLQSLAESLHSK